MPLSDSWFACDVTKNQTKKLAILLSCYFHEVLQHLTPLYKQFFGSEGFFVLRERMLEFDVAFSWWPEKLLCGLKTLPSLGDLLSKHSLSQNKYYFNLYEFLKRRIHALVGKLENRCFCWYPAAILVFLKGTPTWRFHTKLYKFR